MVEFDDILQLRNGASVLDCVRAHHDQENQRENFFGCKTHSTHGETIKSDYILPLPNPSSRVRVTRLGLTLQPPSCLTLSIFDSSPHYWSPVTRCAQLHRVDLPHATDW